jgi:hypothetical protein
MIDYLLRQRSHNILLIGLLYLLILLSSVIFFMVVMGTGSPTSTGFLDSLMIMLNILSIGIGTCLVLFKIIDSILTRQVCWHTFSYMSIFIGSLVYMILFNIFVDNLYQFNKGDYSYNIMGLSIFIIFWWLVIILGNITTVKNNG